MGVSLPGRMCLNKETYDTRQEALSVVEYVYSKEAEEGYSVNLKVYKCPLCQKYHLGSKR